MSRLEHMRFELLAVDGAARRGRLGFARGTVETPAFMPVGTYGTVKAMTPEELESIGAEIVLGNTFHLFLRPGARRDRRARGLAPVHALAEADSDRLRRFSGLEPRRDAQDHGGGRALPFAGRRRAGVPLARGIDAHPAGAGIRHRDELRRVHALSRDRGRGARVDGIVDALGEARLRRVLPRRSARHAVRHRAGRRASGLAARLAGRARGHRLRRARGRRARGRRAASGAGIGSRSSRCR